MVSQIFGTKRNIVAEKYVGFPLTPALSLRERENRFQFLGESEFIGLALQRQTIHPLPEGEGRGEGEASP